MSEDLTVTLDLRDGYQFLVDFGDDRFPQLVMDEPPPLGDGCGPNAAGVLAAAVGNCLSASALFCLRKAHVDVQSMRTTVHVTQSRSDRGRLGIARIDVTLSPVFVSGDPHRIDRCLEIFEDFCVVTQSVRGGIDVQVTVDPVAVGAPSPQPAGIMS